MDKHNVVIENISVDELDEWDNNNPAIMLNDFLQSIRQESKKISSLKDQIDIVNRLKDGLVHIEKDLGLSDNHFEIDTTGKPLVIKENNGQHYILPTHFENGAYFSSPHFDHELNFDKNKIPKLHIGKYVRFGKGASINLGADVYIGDYVWLAPGSILLRQEHDAYGRPSIAARTVGMTRQPKIHMEDYPWVGIDALVGWNCGYIGKFSIVGARSFINKWVGDYSIVGDHSRILGYMPYKAYLDIFKETKFEDILKIKDWNNIYNEWENFYSKNKNIYEKGTNSITQIINNLVTKRDRVLVLNPTNISNISNTNNGRIDYFVQDRKIIPFVLEELKRFNINNSRIREYNGHELPLDNNEVKLGKETGYKLIIKSYSDNTSIIECMRVLQTGGYLVISQKSKDPVNNKNLIHVFEDNDYSVYRKYVVKSDS